MLKRHPLMEGFEKNQRRLSAPDYHLNLKIFEAMYQEAKRLGAFPLKDPLEGLEVDLRLARALNVRGTAPEDRNRSGS